jgi:hypothetical protein
MQRRLPMPKNEVLERMAKKVHQIVERAGQSLGSWEKLPEMVKYYYFEEALELLGIVEEKTYRSYKGGSKFIVCNPVLEEAFQLAREARERREKGVTDEENHDRGR